MITSASNAKLKLVRALAGRSKARREAGVFLAEGVRLVEDALASAWPFRFVLHSDQAGERAEQLLGRLELRGVEIIAVPEKLLTPLSGTESPQGIIAVLENARPQPPQVLNYVLIADAVRDPGNLGSLLRSAEAAGFEGALLTPGTADAYAPKVVRAGMGAHFRLPIYEVTWGEIGTQAASYGWSVYLAEVRGTPFWKTTFRPPLALIVGGEANGASGEARTLATEVSSIPMQGGAESLNAAAAGAVLMFEVAKQRGITSAPSRE